MATRFRLDADDEFGDLESQLRLPLPRGAAAATPQPRAAHAEASPQVPSLQPSISDDEFSRQWLMSLASERSLGRPKEWDGKESGFDTFAFRFSNWLGSVPGDAEALL
jgi:hypothetical protein